MARFTALVVIFAVIACVLAAEKKEGGDLQAASSFYGGYGLPYYGGYGLYGGYGGYGGYGYPGYYGYGYRGFYGFPGYGYGYGFYG